MIAAAMALRAGAIGALVAVMLAAPMLASRVRTTTTKKEHTP